VLLRRTAEAQIIAIHLAHKFEIAGGRQALAISEKHFALVAPVVIGDAQGGAGFILRRDHRDGADLTQAKTDLLKLREELIEDMSLLAFELESLSTFYYRYVTRK
jgi:hypothetical protein